MSGYWGDEVLVQSADGSSINQGWPYAYSNSGGWANSAYNSDFYAGNGMSLNSEDQLHLGLRLRKEVYSLRMMIEEESGIDSRVIFHADNGDSDDVIESVRTWDLLASESLIELYDGSSTISAPINRGGLMYIPGIGNRFCMDAIWTNIPPATYNLTGATHTYLSTSSDVSFVCFDWGDYPGAPPATEPPDESDVATQPLPMHLFTCSDVADFSVVPSAEVDISVVYSSNDHVYTNHVPPDLVELTDLGGQVLGYDAAITESRVGTSYVNYQGDFYKTTTRVINTVNESPATMPLPPYRMNVIARQKAARDAVVTNVTFMLNGSSYTTTKDFTGLTCSPNISEDYSSSSPWYFDHTDYTVPPAVTSPLEVSGVIECIPRVRLMGTIVNSVSSNSISDAMVRIYRADGGDVRIGNRSDESGKYTAITKTDENGNFVKGYILSGMGGYMVDVTAPGYLPSRTHNVLGDIITGTATNSSPDVVYFKAEPAEPIALTPVQISITKDSWNRQGSVLHSVKAAGTADQPETGAAVQLTAQISATIPNQTYPFLDFAPLDEALGSVKTKAVVDEVTEIWLVDARRKNALGDYIPLLAATTNTFYPSSIEHMPPASDPEKIQAWVDGIGHSSGFSRRYPAGSPAVSVTVTGIVNVAEFYPGNINPVLVAKTRNGGCRMLALGTNLIDSVKLPRWLAFAADTFAHAATAQGKYADIKETFAGKIPDGKLSALPKLSGGISEEDGYLTYAYTLGIEWEEGADSPSKGILGMGPGSLGLEFEAEATVGFEGNGKLLTFEAGGSVGKEEIELEDYMPKFLGKLGVEGTINKVGGMASTKRSVAIDGAEWTERELVTTVGASLDLMLRYNLEGLTGKIPYVGPFLLVADKTGALQLFGRMDMGGRVESRSVWQTLEVDRAPAGTNSYVILFESQDDKKLTPERHCFGGMKNTKAVTSNYFALGMTFGISIEGSALGDRLYVRAGIEITGNESDLVAGEPSLVIIPNTFGDWPPIKRVQGDVNALIDAKLDAYVTEIEKSWRMNLARIDYQFTTESILTMTDLVMEINETPTTSTVFNGTSPVVVANLPKGSSYAMQGDMLVCGMYDQALGRTDLVVSYASGGGFSVPATIATVADGLGHIHLANLGDGKLVLAWEERPGIQNNFFAYSVLKAAFYDGSSWGTQQTAVSLGGYVTDMELFVTGDKVSIVYYESPESRESKNTRLQAVLYDENLVTWSAPKAVQGIFEKGAVALACAGGGSDEPGRAMYLVNSGSIYSLFWDGERRAVPEGSSYKYVSGNKSDWLALCSGGTNETLYLNALHRTGELALYQYVPDPTRDPNDPNYDWNSRDRSLMWPLLGTCTNIDGDINALANGWIPDADRLLTVWSKNGSLYGNLVNAATISNAVNFTITSSVGGEYKDIRIVPVSNTLARVTARYISPTVNELRIFNIETGSGLVAGDADGDGHNDVLELILVDFDPDDAIESIGDVNGGDDFDGDGYSNAEEWAAGTHAEDPGSFPNTGVSVDTAVAMAREDGRVDGEFLITRDPDDPATNALTIHFTIAGDAQDGTDYETIARSVNIASNATYALVSIQPIDDSVPEGNETVILTLQPNAAYILGGNIQAVVTIKDATLDSWKYTMFSEAERNNPAISGDNKDPDGDGIPNLMEYGMGLDPLQDDSGEHRLDIYGDGPYLKYIRNQNISDALFIIEKTTNLVNTGWSSSTNDLDCINRELRSDGSEEVIYQDSGLTNHGFYRLKMRHVE